MKRRRTQKVYASAGKQDVYVIKSTRNGKAVAKATMSVLPGIASPFSVSVQHAFVAGSSMNAAGTNLVPGYYTTGLTGMIKRSVEHPDVIQFNVTNTALLSMTTKHGVQFPSMDIQTFNQSIALAPGEKLNLTGYSKGGGTTVVTIMRE